MSDLPRPAPPHWPYQHRTLAEVEADRREKLLEAHRRVTGRVVVPPTVRLR